MKFSPLAAQEFAKITTSITANDENFLKMMAFPFWWLLFIMALFRGVLQIYNADSIDKIATDRDITIDPDNPSMMHCIFHLIEYQAIPRSIENGFIVPEWQILH